MSTKYPYWDQTGWYSPERFINKGIGSYSYYERKILENVQEKLPLLEPHGFEALLICLPKPMKKQIREMLSGPTKLDVVISQICDMVLSKAERALNTMFSDKPHMARYFRIDLMRHYMLYPTKQFNHVYTYSGKVASLSTPDEFDTSLPLSANYHLLDIDKEYLDYKKTILDKGFPSESEMIFNGVMTERDDNLITLNSAWGIKPVIKSIFYPDKEWLTKKQKEVILRKVAQRKGEVKYF